MPGSAGASHRSSDSQSGGPTGLRPSAELLETLDPSGLGFVTTGGADVIFPGEPQLTAVGDPLQVSQRISYDAKTLSNGTVQGEFQAMARLAGVLLTFHGTVQCYTIDANVARVVGFVTHASDPAFEKQYVQWTSQDNGEGFDSPPDGQSNILPAPTKCPPKVGLTDDLLPVESGNVQVHPAQSSQ